MKEMKSVFLSGIKKAKNADDMSSVVRDAVFELTRKDIGFAANEDEIIAKTEYLFSAFMEALESEKIKTADNITAVIEGLSKSANCEKKQRLVQMMYEIEQLEKSIYQQSKEIKNITSKIYSVVENKAKNENAQTSQIIIGLNNAKLLNLEMMGILRDVAEEAFIAAIEQSNDIKDTIMEIGKTLSYKAISEEKFTLQRVSSIANIIIETACDIADSDYMRSSDIIKGSTEGVREGVIKAAEKFKNDIKFAPEEIKILFEHETNINQKELINIEEYFVEILQQIQVKSNGISSIILSKIIAEYNTYPAKIKRFSAKTTEIFNSKMENFKDKELKEFKKRANKKIEEIKKEAIPKAKQMTDEAKSLGVKTWESAKNMINSAKEKRGK